MNTDHMKILHGELLEGILSFVNEEVDNVIDERIQQVRSDGLDDD